MNQWIFNIYVHMVYIYIETGEGSYLRLMLDWKMTWSQSWVQFTTWQRNIKKRSQWAAASMARSESHLYPGTSKKNGRNVLQKVFVQRFHFPVNTSLQWGLFSPQHLHCEAHATQEDGGLVKLLRCLSLLIVMVNPLGESHHADCEFAKFSTRRGIGPSKNRGDILQQLAEIWPIELQI